jgi:hypothetical protein
MIWARHDGVHHAHIVTTDEIGTHADALCGLRPIQVGHGWAPDVATEPCLWCRAHERIRAGGWRCD